MLRYTTVDETAVKLLNEPPETVISSAAKPVAASLAVNLSAIVESFVVDPLETPGGGRGNSHGRATLS